MLLAGAPPASSSCAARLRRSRSARRSAGALQDGGGVCGIDLGTTNCCVAVVEEGRPVVVPVDGGHSTLPSQVAYLPDGSVLVGRAAAARALLDPASAFHSVKRLLGRSHAQAAASDARTLPYRLAPAPGGGVHLLVPSQARCVTPEQACCELLRPLLAAAALRLGRPVARAVVTVPAYFDDAQRAAVAAAARLAGVGTVKLLREPVAAALAYGLGRAGDSNVLVFDLGGGTFDCSLLALGGGACEVLASGGDARLGGDDLDSAVADWLRARLPRPPPPRAALQRAARALREALSVAPAVRAAGLGGSEGERITRAQIERLMEPALQRLRLPLEQACWTAGVDLAAARGGGAAAAAAATGAPPPRSRGGGKRGARAAARPAARAISGPPAPGAPAGGRRLDAVLLVGGATRTPAVRRLVAEMTGLQPLGGAEAGGVDPDCAVALGAAVQAGALEGSIVEEAAALEPFQAALMRALARHVAAGAADEEEWEEEEGEGEAE